MQLRDLNDRRFAGSSCGTLAIVDGDDGVEPDRYWRWSSFDRDGMDVQPDPEAMELRPGRG
jgi:hypothetical protein